MNNKRMNMRWKQEGGWDKGHEREKTYCSTTQHSTAQHSTAQEQTFSKLDLTLLLSLTENESPCISFNPN